MRNPISKNYLSCIYYGDEVGVDGRHDPECRKAFPWDESKWDKELLEFAKACTTLRTEHAALRRGEYKRLYAEGEVAAFMRSYKNEHLTVVFNTATEDRSIELHFEKKPRVLLGNASLDGNRVTIPARSGIVLK